MIARTEAYKHAANLIAYLVASEHTTGDQRDALKRDFAVARGEAQRDTPLDEVPDLLPDPITDAPIAA